MHSSPRFYVIGTKYARSQNFNVLPELTAQGVIATGFAGDVDLSPIIGADHETARAWLCDHVGAATSPAVNTLSRFVGIGPGDVIALKSHSAPLGRQARLVIARYAVVRGKQRPTYKRMERLGHTLAVDFLDDHDPLEFPLGYGQTLHEITSEDRKSIIFGPYAKYAGTRGCEEAKDKLTSASVVAARGSYLMKRVHNALQNELRRKLILHFGIDAVAQEQDRVDLMVTLESEVLLIEVKSSPSPIACMREALGQLLQYSWNLGVADKKARYLVVGPSELAAEDFRFLAHLKAETGLPLRYCTPASFSPPGDA